MTINLKTLRSIEAIPALDVLKKIWNARDQFEHPPLLSIGVGRSVMTGWLCNLDTKSTDLPMVLSVPGANGFPSEELVFVSARQIDWISVRDGQPLFSLLSGGAIDPLADEPAPGKLQINRRSKEIAEQLARLTGKQISIDHKWYETTDDSRSLSALNATLDALEQAINHTIADEFSKSAVTEKIKSIAITLGDKRSCTLASGILNISLCPSAAVNGRFSATELKNELNGIL